MFNKPFALAILLMVGLAQAQYAQGNFFFQSGAAITGIGAIFWVTPTLGNYNITVEKWIFGNVTYVGTAPDYQTFILDFENKSILCNLGNNCFKNETGLKKGWHSIQVYLSNAGGQNWSERRYIYVNVSGGLNTPLIIMSEEAGVDYSTYLFLIGISGIGVIGMFAYYKKRDEDGEQRES